MCTIIDWVCQMDEVGLLFIKILFYPKGLMGREEFEWDKLFSGYYLKKLKFKKN